MFLPDAELESTGLSLLPTEYVREIENRTALRLLDRMRSPFTEWEIREGYPDLVKFDKPGYEGYLRSAGVPEDQIHAYVSALADPEFNARNRRGFDRLRKRLVACRDTAIQLWGPGQRHLQDVPVGVAMLDYLNAGAHPVPKGGSAILMNIGLAFLHDYFVLWLQTQQQHAGNMPAEAIDRLARLAKAIFGDSKNRGEFITAFPRTLAADGDTALMSRIKMALASLFILLHEYGHVALGHTDELRKWPRLELLPPSERREYCATMRAWEFEADRFALDTLLGKMALPGTPVPDPGLVDMTMSDVFGLMSLAVGKRTSESPDDTHPLPHQRILKLYGARSVTEFHDRVAKSRTDTPKDDEFINKMLIPILRASGAVKGDDPPAQ